jgi:tetratricopeptide (TPR) repeat protein
MLLTVLHHIRIEGRLMRMTARGVFLASVLLAAPDGWSQTGSSASPANVPTVRSAAAAIASGDAKRAESELAEILESSPNDVHALNLLGILRAQQQRHQEAQELFQKAIAIQTDFAAAHASLGLLYVQMGKDDLAVAELQQTLKLDPGRKDAEAALLSIWKAQARRSAQSGDLEKALALLIEARKLNSGDPDVQFEFGMVALRMSLFLDAIDGFDQALKFRSDDSQALYGLGRAKIALAKFDDARQIFERYVQLHPEDASGHYALGFTLQALERPAEARAEYEKSIELQILQTESYYQLGLMELEAGNLHAAAAQFNRVLKRAPQHGGALTGLGRVRFEEKNYDEAVSLLSKAVASNARLREAHYYLGLTDARLGRKEDSEKELAIASRIEHEEVEKHQNVLRIIDPDQLEAPQPKPDSSN